MASRGANKAEQLAEALRQGRCTDTRFDALYPRSLQAFSSVHFTPVEVAMRAARWLAPTSSARVLDVGAGAGKFCAVAAATTGAELVGVEARPTLLAAARELVRTLGLERVRFQLGEASGLPWDLFDAFYLFNPFAESSSDPESWLGPLPVKPDPSLDIAWTCNALESRPAGTRVATYCGYGAPMPAAFVAVERIETGSEHDYGELCLWEKR